MTEEQRLARIARTIKVADERGELERMVDGDVCYFPKNGGIYSSLTLRALADELDRRNNCNEHHKTVSDSVRHWSAVVCAANPRNDLQKMV